MRTTKAAGSLKHQKREHIIQHFIHLILLIFVEDNPSSHWHWMIFSSAPHNVCVKIQIHPIPLYLSFVIAPLKEVPNLHDQPADSVHHHSILRSQKMINLHILDHIPTYTIGFATTHCWMHQMSLQKNIIWNNSINNKHVDNKLIDKIKTANL